MIAQLRKLAHPLVDAARDVRRRLQRGPIVHEAIAVTEAEPAGDGGFDEERAFGLLRAQCEMGARAPGTEGHARTRDWLVDQFAPLVDGLVLQRWTQKIARGPGAGQTFAMTNLLALVHGSAGSADEAPDVMLSAHWDTRPVADRDPDPARRALPVPGANDGASGVAVVLEAARALRARRPPRPVVLALWDGEDLGEYYYGSRAYTDALARGTAPWRPRRGILLDMVGKRGLRCSTELHSERLAPGLWRQVHAAADALGLGAHFGGRRFSITDDHVFLNRAGIPTVLLIDYEYPPWHTTADTVDQCDARALEVVGDVVLHFVRAGAP